MQKLLPGETVVFTKCIKRERHSGTIENILEKGTIGEKYVVNTNGKSMIVPP